MTGRRRPPRYPGGSRQGQADEALLSDEEVQRRVNVEGGGQLQQPPPEHKFRDRRPTPAVRRAKGGARGGSRDSLLVVGLAIVGLVAVGVLLPDGPLTSASTSAPSDEGTAAAVAPTGSPSGAPVSTAGLITLPPRPSSSAAASSPAATLIATPPPAPTATPRPGSTPRVTATPTKAPTPTPTKTAAPTGPAPARLTVVVVVENDDGGTRTASDWTIHVTSGGTATPSSFPASASGTLVTLTPNATYSVDIDGPAGYVTTKSPECSSVTGGLPAAGSNQTCRITKDDVKPRMTVRTVVDNGVGGSQAPNDWTVTVHGTAVDPKTFAGSASGVTVRLNANATFWVEMANPNDEDYELAPSGTCSGDGLSVGAGVTCTFTYTYTPPAPPATGAVPFAPLAVAALLGERRRWIRRST